MSLPTITFEVGRHAQTDSTGARMIFLATPDSEENNAMILFARADPYPGIHHNATIIIRPDMPEFTNASDARDWVIQTLSRS